MIEKNETYWLIHKKVSEELYDQLDNEIKQMITNNPKGREGNLFNDRIELEVRNRLTEV